LISASGVIENFALTPASIEEHRMLNDLTEEIEGLLIGDKGYLGKKHKQDLLNRNILLQTPLKKNMKDTRLSRYVQRIKKMRKIIESVIAQLIYRFKIFRIWARDRFHLFNRLSRIFLAHIIGVFSNRKLGRRSIIFDGLLC
jgi:hypothetical protein